MRKIVRKICRVVCGVSRYSPASSTVDEVKPISFYCDEKCFTDAEKLKKEVSKQRKQLPETDLITFVDTFLETRSMSIENFLVHSDIDDTEIPAEE